MVDSKKYDGSQWKHSLRKLTTATEAVENPLYSDGTAITSYTIKGNTVQNGTPTPLAPVDVVGVGTLDSGQYKIPILSANTTTPIYLGEVETTRRVKKLVLTGEENWTIYSEFSAQNCYQFNTNITNHNVNSEAISTHFVYTSALRTLIDNDGTFMFDSNKYIRVHISSCTTLDDFKSYLTTQYANGTPVTVWYVLAEPETGIVNEPLMKIGDYADILSNATAIPTTEGANSITVDTTVQPSEFTATWTGWHNATVKEWDGSDWG